MQISPQRPEGFTRSFHFKPYNVTRSPADVVRPRSASLPGPQSSRSHSVPAPRPTQVDTSSPPSHRQESRSVPMSRPAQVLTRELLTRESFHRHKSHSAPKLRIAQPEVYISIPPWRQPPLGPTSDSPRQSFFRGQHVRMEHIGPPAFGGFDYTRTQTMLEKRGLLRPDFRSARAKAILRENATCDDHGRGDPSTGVSDVRLPWPSTNPAYPYFSHG